MTVTFNWYDNSQHILVIRMLEGWTWDDYRAIEAEYLPQIQQQNHDVAIIVDIRRYPSLPKHTVQEIRDMTTRKPHNVTLAVVIGSKPEGLTLWRIINKIYRWPLTVEFADSLEEAYDTIQEHKRDIR